MRGKLGTGKHLDETYVLLPQVVPHAEGVCRRNCSSSDARRQRGWSASAPPEPSVTGDADPRWHGPEPDLAPGGSIFGGGAMNSVRQLSTAGATSALNLLGKVESWGITPGTQVQDLQLKVANLTGAQLNDLLKKLPDGITYELTLNKEES